MIESVAPPPPPEPVAPPAEPTLPPRQWTYREVAVIKRVQPQTVMDWVKKGMVPSPVYTGMTARFTEEHVSTILTGTSAPGTYPVTPSPRSAIGKMGGSSTTPAKGKAKNPAQQKAAIAAAARAKAKAKKPTKKVKAKKPVAAKRGAK